jgi:hypothetical protein
MWVFLKCKRICTGYCLIIHHHMCMPIANLGTCFPLAHVVVYLCVPIPNQDLVYHQHIPWSICVCLSQTRTLLSTSSCRGLFVCAYPKPGHCFPPVHVVVYLCVPIPNQDIAFHQLMSWSICVCLSQTRTLLSTSSCRGLFVYAYPKPGHCCPPAHVVVYLCVPILNQDIAFHQLMSWSICVQ